MQGQADGLAFVPSAEWRPVEVRSSLPSRREARVFFGFHDGMLIALHAMIKKTQKTPTEDLTLARQRFRELQSWQGKTRT